MTSSINHLSVAEFIDQQIRLSGKTQAEIAKEIGYTNPNIMTMFKQGKTKIPLDKIGPLAKALEIDPALLLRRVMGEYMPDTLAALESILEGLTLTPNELELVRQYRKVTTNKDASANI